MAIQRNPNDPFRGDDGDPLRRTDRRFDNELQADPELSEGPAGGGRIALFAIAVVAILGVVFYGLNSPTTTTTPTAQTTPAPVTNDTAATRPPVGQTTGSAMTPSQPSTSSPSGQNPNATSTDNGVQFSPSPSTDRGSTSGTAPAGTGPANN